MEVREGMSSVVLTVGPGHTLREAATRMTEKGVGAAVVIDEESPGPRRRLRARHPQLDRPRRGPRRRAGRRPHERDRRSPRPPTGASSARRSRCRAATSATSSSSRAAELVGMLSMRDIVRVLDLRRRHLGHDAPESERSARTQAPSERSGSSGIAGRTRRSRAGGAAGARSPGAASRDPALAIANSATIAPTTPYGHQVKSEARTAARPTASISAAPRGLGHVDELGRLGVVGCRCSSPR